MEKHQQFEASCYNGILKKAYEFRLNKPDMHSRDVLKALGRKLPTQCCFQKMKNEKFNFCIAIFNAGKKLFKILVCENMAECIELKTMVADLNKKDTGLGDQEVSLKIIEEANVNRKRKRSK